MERWAFLMGRILVFYSAIIAVLVFYTLTWRHYAVPKALMFQQLVMMLAACWAVIACGRRFIRSSLAASCAFFAIALSISTFFAVNLGEAYEDLTFQLATLVFLLLIPKFLTRFQDFTVFIYLLGVMCFCVDVYGLAQYYNWTDFFNNVFIKEYLGLTQMVSEPVSTMGNINYTAEFLNLVSPIIACMMIVYRQRAAEFLFFAFITLMNAMTLYYIDCNATYAGFMAAVPVVLLILIYDRVLPALVNSGILRSSLDTAHRYFRHAVVVMILLTALGAAMLTSIPNKALHKVTTMVSWVDSDGDNVSDGNTTIIFRLQCMDSAMRGIMDNFWQGIGPGNFKVIHPLYETQLERKVLGREVLARKVHNDHLQHALKYGVFGLLGWYWIISVTLYAIIYSLYHLRNAGGKQGASQSGKGGVLTPFERQFYFYLQLGILGSLITALVSCLFAHTFVIQSSAVLYWCISGIACSVFQQLHRLNRNVQQPWYGVTPENPIPPQQFLGHVPVWMRGAILFVILLPLGAANLYQMIGETWLKIGMLQRDNNQYSTTFYSMRRAMHYWPYQMEIYYIMGRYYIDAISEYTNVKDQPEEQQRAYLVPKGLAVNSMQKYLKEGIVSLQTDLFMNPNYKWAHNNLGVFYDRLENFDLSKAAYNRVLDIDKEQIYAQFNLGLGYLRRGDFATAVKYLETAANIEPDYLDAYQYMARGFIGLRDFPRALIATDNYVSYLLQNRLLQEMSSTIGARRVKPIVDLMKQGDLTTALSEAQRILGFTDSTTQQLYLQIAYELIVAQSNAEKAKDALVKSDILLSDTNPEQIRAVGSLYQELNDMESAAKKFQQYVRLKPRDWEARRTLANLYATTGDYESAISIFRDLIASDGIDFKDYISMARLMIGAGKYRWPDIIPFIQKSVEAGGDNARQLLIEPGESNFIYPWIKKEPALQNIIGDEYYQKYLQNAGPE